MTSFNHYALGAVADWMHRVHRRHRSARSRATAGARRPAARWRADLGAGQRSRRRTAGSPSSGASSTATWLEVDVTVPDGVTADIELPDGRRQRVTGRPRTS